MRPRWTKRLNRGPVAQASPVVPGQHPTNCPLCRGSKLVWYTDRQHGQIQLPCPAFSTKQHNAPEFPNY